VSDLTLFDVDAEFEALMLGVECPELFDDIGIDPTELPDWLTDPDPMYPTPPKQEDYVPRHSTGRERCPWLDVVVPEPTEHPGVEAAATTAMLDLQVGFIKSPTAKHAHDGTALAMIDHAADQLRAALKQRSIPRGDLRSLLHQLEAMR
jgi:hypothetical protein